MSRTILFIAAFWLAVPLWGQSGIMPRRSSSIKIPSQETMEKITEADPELVSREPVSTLSDTISRALLFSPVAVDMLGYVLETIHDGDILAIVTRKKGLDTSHLGFAVWQKGCLHLLNASSIHKKVVLEPMTLSEYMKKHPSQLGVRVVRVI